ncbi:uncharacterized protein LOC126682528 [Mercurialis annua]|uniref:uncharacterized protein LOC126682528 n=1 Tax=Mercurialis annua TaxID=3986 RepID=UPI002160143A|nr:uncharacterized protein LOC126682528 [Mercurialis annua]
MAQHSPPPQQHSPPPPSPPAATSSLAAEQPQPDLSSPPPPPFDPSRMIGIIKRKALIKKLAAVYHAECLAYCQQLLDLQNKFQEPFIDLKAPDESRKEPARPAKRHKKSAR